MQELTLGDFLRARRAAVAPGQGDLRSAPSRRVKGMRREEVAQRVGVSVDYYVKLEQGRRVTPSDNILHALADVLELDEAAHEHLFDLARRDSQPKPRHRPTQRVSLGMIRLMESLGEVPAILTGRRTDILAANPAARLVIDDFHAIPARERNGVRHVLLSDKARLIHRDWEASAAGLVGMLRMYCGRHPNDPRAAELVAELTAKSDAFRQLWSERHVAKKIILDSKVIEHPVVGPIRLHLEAVQTTEDREQTLHVMMPDSASRSALRHLNKLAGDR
ncbi:XRE family transcriptional regulator [Micromonospora sp. 15K316]|uniref:helix-turn-helix transcriptional regulator n=1 Tax=Micromonospora sp. 15K316 TaxID=2530376 RepID=UPI001049F2BE|nr:helix-turn-helix transcriptional regulator [Micromonospora sp. 15K316]TDC29062.1 XRE family transcriptional regulator [Micromonospora sp. 15K316]